MAGYAQGGGAIEIEIISKVEVGELGQAGHGWWKFPCERVLRKIEVGDSGKGSKLTGNTSIEVII